MYFFNLGAPKAYSLCLFKVKDPKAYSLCLFKTYGLTSQETVHQTNQSLQSIKYHRTKWPWFPFKIKMIPLRPMGRWCYNSPIVQFIFHIHTYILMNFMCTLQNWKLNIFQNHNLSLNNRLSFVIFMPAILWRQAS